MSIKEQFRKIVTDPQKGQELSKQMIRSFRDGSVPVVELEDGRRIRLIRVGQKRIGGTH